MEHNPYYKNGELFRKHNNGVINKLSATSIIRGKKYILFTKNYKRYYAHRYIWEINFGKIPKGMVIDHINNNSLDNRIENLKCVTQSENLLNKNNKRRSDNKSGVRGVSFCNKYQKWVAQIQVEGANLFLGQSKDKQQAVSLRKKAEKLYGV